MTVATSANETQQKPQKSLVQRVLLPVLLILVGLGVLLYPVVATQWNNHVQQQITEKYEEQFRNAQGAPQIAQQVQEAREYNASHTDGPILDPWLARISEDNVEYQEYLGQLDGAPAMSQVVIPSLEVKLPVYHGTSTETLQKGLGHLFGTALPVGGEGTHAVITGHTGLTNATMFDNLSDIQVGDGIYVSTFGERMKYEVHDTEVVLPSEVDSLGSKPGEDLITLITCTPYGINTHRLLVHAHRVPLDDETVFDQSASNQQWWMWALVALAVLIIAALIWWVRNEKKKQKSLDTGADLTADRGRHRA